MAGWSYCRSIRGLGRAPQGPRGMGGLWVVRPDGYVGLAARSDDGAAAEAYLAAINV
jgi:hypothetical protein